MLLNYDVYLMIVVRSLHICHINVIRLHEFDEDDTIFAKVYQDFS